VTQSRFYARPKSYTTGAGDPRGQPGATAAERTAFRYQAPFGQWGTVAFTGDPVRYDGQPEICDVSMIPAAGIANGTLLEVCDGFGELDTYEFRADGGPVTPGNILVDIMGAVTAADVATAFFNAIGGIGPLCHVSATIEPGDIVRLAQDAGWYGGRTGFSPAVTAGSGGVVRSQTLPALFLVTRIEFGLDPLEVLPGWLGLQPVLISVNARPLFLVT
jgi:hypothetical protein